MSAKSQHNGSNITKAKSKYIKTNPRARITLNILKSAWLITQVVLVLIFMGAFFAAGVGAGYFASHIKDEPLRSYHEIDDAIHTFHSTGEAYFRDGTLIGEMRSEIHLYPVTLDEVSDYFIDALLATEDSDFHKHEGVNIRGFSRAVLEELTTPGRGTGGSTITQQLVKMQILSPERTLERKFKEMALAVRVEQMFEKDEILEAYLNIIYYGFNANGSNIEGIGTAAEGIFGTHVSQLNLPQAAYLAGMIHSPGRYTPFNRSGSINDVRLENGVQRAHYVLGRMLQTERITEQQYEAALRYDYKNNLAQPSPTILDQYPYLTFSIEDHAVDILIDEMLREAGLERNDVNDLQAFRSQARRELSRGGYKVYTTIDQDLYHAFHEVAAEHTFGRRSLDKTFTRYNPETEREETVGYLEQSAAVLIDNETGAILAKLEGRDYQESQINFTTRPFQPGSAAKPIFAYGPAFEEGVLQPASVLDDRPIFEWGEEGEYLRNVDRRYHGLMTVREALVRSFNTPAARAFRMLYQEVGADRMYEYVQKMGLQHIQEVEMHQLATAIGGVQNGWTVEQGTAAFSTFANKGEFVQPYLIERIETMDGEIIYEHSPRRERVFSEQTAYLITDVLRDVVSSGTASNIGNIMRSSDLDIAGKTGTTNDANDYWFIGYTPQLSMGIWTGYQERDQLSAGYGPRTRELWAKLLQKAVEVRPEYGNTELTFEEPDGIVLRTVCSKSGMLPSELCEQAEFLVEDYFNRNFVPTETDDKVVEQRVVIVDEERYIALESTPEDFIEGDGIMIIREPLEIPEEYIEEGLKRTGVGGLLPEDWDDTAPTELDPREPTEKIPDTPENVRIQNGTLTWEAVADQDIAGYRIYSIDQNLNTEHVMSVADHLEKEFDELSGSLGYYITAVDILGQESSPSEIVLSSNTDPGSFFGPDEASAPTGLQANVSSSHIDIVWDANNSDEEISHYVVYVSVNSGSFTELDQSSSTQFRHHNPEENDYRYRVTAVNSKGESSPSSTIRVNLSDQNEQNNGGGSNNNNNNDNNNNSGGNNGNNDNNNSN